jgi:hypothetical protein
MDIESEIWIIFQLGSIVGASVMLVASLTILPASYMMNKYIHHTVVLRWCMAVFGTIFGLFVVVYAFVMAVAFNKKVYYFGMFPSYIPMLAEDTQSGGGEAGSWLTRIYDSLLQLSSPLSIFTEMFVAENFLLPDSNAYQAYRENIKSIYEGNLEMPKFDVDLMARIKDAGHQPSLDTWMGAIGSLEADCGRAFASTP